MLQAMPTEVPALLSLPPDRRARVTLIANPKGGVGKSTIALNTAAALARGVPHAHSGVSLIARQRVLLVDLEPLRTLTRVLVGGSRAIDGSGSAMLLEEVPETVLSNAAERRGRAELLLGTAILPALHEPFYIVPAVAPALEKAEAAKGGLFAMEDNLEILRPYFDHIILDVPGHATGRTFRAAAHSADGVLIPVQPTGSSVTGLPDLFSILRDIRRAQRNLKPAVDGIVISMLQRRDDPRGRQLQTLLKDVPVHIFQGGIRNLVAIGDSPASHCSVYEMPGAERATEDFGHFVNLWLEKIGGGR